jgi:phosphotransferase system IIB component
MIRRCIMKDNAVRDEKMLTSRSFESSICEACQQYQCIFGPTSSRVGLHRSAWSKNAGSNASVRRFAQRVP